MLILPINTTVSLAKTGSLLSSILLITYLILIELFAETETKKQKKWFVFYPIISVLLVVFVFAVLREFFKS